MYDDLAGSGDLLRDPAPPDDAGAIRFRRERDLGDVVNVTFRFLRDNARELGRGLLVIAGPAALVAAILSTWAQLQIETALSGPYDPSDPAALFGSEAYLRGLAVSLVVVVAMQLLIQSIVLGYVEGYRRGAAGALAPTELWEATKRAFGPVFSTMAVTVALLFALFVAVSLVTALVPVLGLLGALALMALAVYLVPILTLLYVQRVAEGDGFWEGFEATRDLVRGHWWFTFGLLVVVALLVFAVSIVLSVPGLVVQTAFGFNTLDGGGGLSVVAFAVTALFGVLLYAAYVLPVVAAAFQYFNLVERRDGTGLLARVDALGAEPRDEAAPSWRPSAGDGGPEAGGFRGGGFPDEGGGRAR